MPTPATQLIVIDDEPSMRVAYSRLAKAAKMGSRSFASVEEFLRADVADDHACVVCDVRMEGPSGLDLPKLLESAGRRLPVIFVTAHDTAETRDHAQRAGAVAYFRKPVDDQALLDAIAWAVSGQRASTSTPSTS